MGKIFTQNFTSISLFLNKSRGLEKAAKYFVRMLDRGKGLCYNKCC